MSDIDAKDIRTIPIYDKTGKYIGAVTGRREQIMQYSNKDLAAQIQRDIDKQKDRQC